MHTNYDYIKKNEMYEGHKNKSLNFAEVVALRLWEKKIVQTWDKMIYFMLKVVSFGVNLKKKSPCITYVGEMSSFINKRFWLIFIFMGTDRKRGISRYLKVISNWWSKKQKMWPKKNDFN